MPKKRMASIIVAVVFGGALNSASANELTLEQFKSSLSSEIRKSARIIRIDGGGARAEVGDCRGDGCQRTYVVAKRREEAKALGVSLIAQTELAGGWYVWQTNAKPSAGAGSDGTASAGEAEAAPSSEAPIDIMSALTAYDNGSEAYAEVKPQSKTADVATEAVQLLGEIVADRASDRALSVVRDKLETLLYCKAEKGGQPKTIVDLPGTWTLDFTATCDVIAKMKIRSILDDGRALLSALVSDLIGFVTSGLAAATCANGDLLCKDVLQSVIFSARDVLTKLALSKAVEAQGVDLKTIVDDLISIVRRGLEKNAGAAHAAKERGWRVVPLAMAAFAQCWPKFDVFSDECPQLGKILNELQESETHLSGVNEAQKSVDRREVRLLVTNLIIAIRGRVTEDERLERMHEALFGIACSFVEGGECPRLSEVQSFSRGGAVVFFKEVSAALIKEDTNRLVVAGARAVEVGLATVTSTASENKVEAKRVGKGLELASAAVQYALTYDGQTKETFDERQAARKLILEELTRRMTDRSDRGGDHIVSLGGSLRLVGGWRSNVHFARNAFEGPLSLTLGLAYDYVGDESDIGFHLELGVLELGNYLTFEDGVEVREPDVLDGLSVSITPAIAFGRELPIIVGGVFGYSPAVTLEEDDSDKGSGSIYFGVVVGVAVPLLDFN